jgi:hypothetical protein
MSMTGDDELQGLQKRVMELEERLRHLRTGRLVLMNLLKERETEYQRHLANLEAENRLLRERQRLQRGML